MTQLNLHRKLHTTPVSLIFHLPTEDAKKMAVKEEKYDPGYEAAYGSAYSGNPCDSEPCSLPSNGLSMFPPEDWEAMERNRNRKELLV